MLNALAELQQRSTHRGDADPVFASKAGTPLDYTNTYPRVFKPAARRAGVPWAGFHTLRHTCATLLFRNGLNAKQVQHWLGHHSPAFTLDVYVHLLPDALPTPTFLDTITTPHSETQATLRPRRLAARITSRMRSALERIRSPDAQTRQDRR